MKISPCRLFPNITSSLMCCLGMSCCHLSLIFCIIPVPFFLLLVILCRQGQFQADLKDQAVCPPHRSAFVAFNTSLLQTHTLYHPKSVCLSVWRSVSLSLSSSLPLPWLLKATCQPSQLTFQLPHPFSFKTYSF